MFQSLIASQPTAIGGAHRYLVALGIHGALALAAVSSAGTSGAAVASRSFKLPIAVALPRPVPPSAPPASREQRLAERSVPPTGAEAIRVPEIDPLVLSTRMPTIAPLLESSAGVPAASPGYADLGGGALPITSGPLDPAVVDDPVNVVHQPLPHYPPALARASIAGRVELEYVVDTMGKVESGSLRTLRSTHPEFEAAARASVLAARFEPARLRGRLVRQLVRQTLTFRPDE
jgi:TonB family protein